MASKKACVNSIKTEPYLSYMIVPLQAAGFWEWFPETDKFILKLINIVYCTFSLSIVIQMNISLFCQLFFHYTNFVEVIDTIMNAVAYMLCAYLLIYFRIFQKDFYHLINYLENNFRFHSAKGLSNISMLPSLRFAKTLSITYFLICVSGCCVWVVAAIFSEEFRSMPMVMWYPFDESKTPFYQIAFIVQALAQLILGFAVGAFCSLITSNCILICGQLDLLSCSIRNTRYTSALRSGMPYSMLHQVVTTLSEDELCNYFSAQPELVASHYHYDQRVVDGNSDTHFSEDPANGISFHARGYQPNDIYLPIYNDGAVEALKECIILHIMILEYISQFTKFISDIFFWRILQIVAITCFVMYSLSVNMKVATVCYLCLCVVDTLMYCYFGNEVTVQASKITLALNQSLWHLNGLTYRKMTTFMLLANTKPVFISAGWFFNLNIETFLMVIKTSFSYYTMLQNVHQN